MSAFLLALGVITLGGMAAALLSAWPRLAALAGLAGCLAGAALALIPTFSVLGGASVAPIQFDWNIPGATASLGLDPLSAFFVAPTAILSALAAIYGFRDLDGERLGFAWFCYNLLVASMLVVLTAKNAILFLVAWEAMALSSFFLVTHHDEDAQVRNAGWIYLVSTRAGAGVLIFFFLLLGAKAGSLDFERFAASSAAINPTTAGVLFALAVLGFGCKAGFMPMHVWLPEAHPVAPPHVSAVMSGVMIKTGVYGLARSLSFLGAPAEWWAWTLIAVGLVSAIWGILLAAVQNDLKRLLAYSSIENVGVIATGLGVGLLGLVYDSPRLAVMGFAGGLLHVWNHAAFKGLLFLGAGAVIHATGATRIDRLGGVIKRMPVTAVAFLIGAMAIAGLPPLNGFSSEFLIYLSAFELQAEAGMARSVPAIAVVTGLALAGGFAIGAFAKAFGMTFLGEPRSVEARSAHRAPWLIDGPIVGLAAICALIGFTAPRIVNRMDRVIAPIAGKTIDEAHVYLADGVAPLGNVLDDATALVAILGALAILRWRLLAKREVGATVTWDCGYAAPTARMQYTGSSFAQPITEMFRPLLGVTNEANRPMGLFPERASYASRLVDVWIKWVYEPAFGGIRRALGSLRWLQTGNTHAYVLSIALTLVALLVWYMGAGA